MRGKGPGRRETVAGPTLRDQARDVPVEAPSPGPCRVGTGHRRTLPTEQTTFEHHRASPSSRVLQQEDKEGTRARRVPSSVIGKA